MQKFLKHIILIGFKNVGKTVIGLELASKLKLPFIDLDAKIERIFANENKKNFTCRQIMQEHGVPYFRNLETRVLAEVMQTKHSVISLGGGTPIDFFPNSTAEAHGFVDEVLDSSCTSTYTAVLCAASPCTSLSSASLERGIIDKNNQELIKNSTIIHIDAPREVVFARIMQKGRPAFFSEEESPWVAFNNLWDERDKVYKKLADFSIENNGLIVSAVEKILQLKNDRR